MLAKYDWIAVDMRFFGQPNTAYDFSANDPKEAQKKIQKLEATKVSFELIYLSPFLVDCYILCIWKDFEKFYEITSERADFNFFWYWFPMG